MSSGETQKPRFYNTLTRQKEAFEPIDRNNVRLYVCGPTVYDFAHIGNARPAIVFDVLYRLLRHLYGESNVTYVRNITDVDDKINARAARDYADLPLNEAIRKVTEKTANQYFKDVAALGCLEPDHQPRATENIEQMVDMIATLIANGNAYAAGGEVLFDTTSMPDYGALSGRDLDEQMAGARIAVEEHKRNPGDFVLWKLSDENEPGWDSPWGRGRPGWHLECSAMSERYLWTEMQSKLSDGAKAYPHQFDIHGGGLDLIFPHHENEIAQSRCAHGTPGMANVWMHNGFLQVEGRKMSKSEGNFVTISELLETEKFGGRKWPGEVLRLAMLMTHYREPIDFSVARLEEAAIALESFSTFADTEADAEPTGKFLAALDDDLNTPKAISELHVLLKQARARNNQIAGQAKDPSKTYGGLDNPAASGLAANLRLIGIELHNYDKGWLERSVNENITASKRAEVEKVVEARLAALSEKDFATADKIRDDLLTQGVQLMDYKDPDSGERRTKWEMKS